MKLVPLFDKPGARPESTHGPHCGRGWNQWTVPVHAILTGYRSTCLPHGGNDAFAGSAGCARGSAAVVRSRDTEHRSDPGFGPMGGRLPVSLLGVVDEALFVASVFGIRYVRGLDHIGPGVLALQEHGIFGHVRARQLHRLWIE
jgi:hypothetical protein